MAVASLTVSGSGDRAVHALHQIVLRFQFDSGLRECLARRNHGVALIIFKWAFEHGIATLHDLRLHGIDVLATRVGAGKPRYVLLKLPNEWGDASPQAESGE